MSLVRAIRIINGQSPAYSHASVYGGAESDAHGDEARIPDFSRAAEEASLICFSADTVNCAPRVACPIPALDFERSAEHGQVVRVVRSEADSRGNPAGGGEVRHGDARGRSGGHAEEGARALGQEPSEAWVLCGGVADWRLQGPDGGRAGSGAGEDVGDWVPSCNTCLLPGGLSADRLTAGKDPHFLAGQGAEPERGNENLGRSGSVTIRPAVSENPGGGSPESASPLSAGWSSGSSSGPYPEGRTFESCPRNQLPAEWPAVRPTADECRGSATVALQLLARFSPFHRGGRNGAVAFGDTAHAARVIGSSGWQPGTRPALAFRRAAGTVPDGIRRIGKGFSDSCSYVCSCGLDRLPDCGHPGETGSKRVRGARFFICRAYPHAEAPAVATGWGTLFGARPGGAVHHCLSASASAAGYPAGWRHASPLEPKRHTPPGMHATADGATGGERPAHPCTAARRDNDLPRAGRRAAHPCTPRPRRMQPLSRLRWAGTGPDGQRNHEHQRKGELK